MNPFAGSAHALKIAVYRHEPAAFVQEQFRPEELGRLTPDGIDPAQHEMLGVLTSQEVGKQYVAMQAARGTAKTCGLAWSACWHLACQGDANNFPIGAAVSITEANLRDNLVKEIAFWRSRSPWLMEVLDLNNARLARRDAPDRAFISFRACPPDAGETEAASALSGIHGRYAMVLLDEIGDMSPAIGRKARQVPIEGQRYFKVLAAGNPVSTSSLLYEVVTKLRSEWHVIVITGDPDDPKRSPRVNVEGARRDIAAYGRDNAWVRIYTLGQFPLTALNKFLGPDDIAAAQRRNYERQDIEWAQNRLGIDPARFGDDRTGFVKRQGRVMWPSWHQREMTSTQISAFAAQLNATEGVGPFDMVVVDAGGPNAGGLVDQLRQALGETRVLEVSSSSTKVPDPRCYNLRAYMHEQAARWVKSGGHLPKDEALMEEALAPMYDHKNGKIIVEDKGDLKAAGRLGRSPDLWDAACLTFAVPDAPRLAVAPAGARHLLAGPRFARTDEGDPLGRDRRH